MRLNRLRLTNFRLHADTRIDAGFHSNTGLCRRRSRKCCSAYGATWLTAALMMPRPQYGSPSQ